jgi:hypothetical protein
LQDGTLCLHSLLSWQLLCKSQLSESDAVAAVAFHPAKHPSSSSSSSSTDSSSDAYSLVLFAAAGRELQQLVVTVPATLQAQQQQQSNNNNPRTTAALAGGSDVQDVKPAAEQQQQQLELQVVARQVVPLDDISALAVNHQGTYLAAADDTGGLQRELHTMNTPRSV